MLVGARHASPGLQCARESIHMQQVASYNAATNDGVANSVGWADSRIVAEDIEP